MSLGWLVPKTNTPTGSNHRGHVNGAILKDGKPVYIWDWWSQRPYQTPTLKQHSVHLHAPLIYYWKSKTFDGFLRFVKVEDSVYVVAASGVYGSFLSADKDTLSLPDVTPIASYAKVRFSNGEISWEFGSNVNRKKVVYLSTHGKLEGDSLVAVSIPTEHEPPYEWVATKATGGYSDSLSAVYNTISSFSDDDLVHYFQQEEATGESQGRIKLMEAKPPIFRGLPAPSLNSLFN